MFNAKYLFRYELGVFMYKFIHDFLPFNFKCYFLNVDKVHNHSTKFSQKKLLLTKQ